MIKLGFLSSQVSLSKSIRNKCVFRIKYNLDGIILKYEARLIAKGFLQTQELDYNESLIPVVKSSIIQMILSLTVMNNWVLRQIDINHAFLNRYLTK